MVSQKNLLQSHPPKDNFNELVLLILFFFPEKIQEPNIIINLNINI